MTCQDLSANYNQRCHWPRDPIIGKASISSICREGNVRLLQKPTSSRGTAETTKTRAAAPSSKHPAAASKAAGELRAAVATRRRLAVSECVRKRR